MSSRMTPEKLQANLAMLPHLAHANRDNPDEAVQSATVEAWTPPENTRLHYAAEKPTHAGGPIPGEKAPATARKPRAVTTGRDDSPLVVSQEFSSRDEEQP